MSGLKSRRKGADGERECLKLLGDELGALLNRNLSQTREGGADCVELKGFALEIKRHKRLSRPAWWKQACEQAAKLGVEPLLLYRQDCKPGETKAQAWKAFIHTQDGKYKEGSLIDAAQAIREKWLRWP